MSGFFSRMHPWEGRPGMRPGWLVSLLDRPRTIRGERSPPRAPRTWLGGTRQPRARSSASRRSRPRRASRKGEAGEGCGGPEELNRQGARQRRRDRGQGVGWHDGCTRAVEHRPRTVVGGHLPDVGTSACRAFAATGGGPHVMVRQADVADRRDLADEPSRGGRVYVGGCPEGDRARRGAAGRRSEGDHGGSRPQRS
jgi:hypothetical protein